MLIRYRTVSLPRLDAVLSGIKPIILDKRALIAHLWHDDIHSLNELSHVMSNLKISGNIINDIGVCNKTDLYASVVMLSYNMRPGWIYNYFKLFNDDIPETTLLDKCNIDDVLLSNWPNDYNINTCMEFDWDERFSVAKGRAGADTHITINDLMHSRVINVLICNRDVIGVFKYCNWTNAAVVGWLLAYVCNTMCRKLYWKFFVNVGLFSASQNTAIAYCTEWHTITRRTRIGMINNKLHDDMEYTQSQYFNTLFNRNDYDLDLLAEIEARRIVPTLKSGLPGYNAYSSSNVYSNRQVENDLMDKAIRVVMNASNLKARYVPTFKEFYDRRLQWVAGGSATGFKFDINISDANEANNFKTEKMRAGKRLAMEILDYNSVLKQMYADDPINWCQSAIKYEPAKNRALWTVPIVNYVINSYILSVGEDMLKLTSWCVTSYSPSQFLDVVERRLRRLQEYSKPESRGCAYMWDYSDFNITHTLEMMARIYEILGEYILRFNINVDANIDIKVCIAYMAESMRNTIWCISGSTTAYKLTRALPSGMRGTSYINSICNAAYNVYIQQQMQTIYTHISQTKIKWNQTHFEGTGDDVYSEYNDWRLTTLLDKLYNILGLAGNPRKLLDSKYDGEMLRVLHTPNGTYGYLNRALTSCVCGEFSESIDYDDPISVLASTDEFNDKLRRRGCEVKYADAITNMISKKRARLVYTDNSGKRKVILPDKRILTARVWNGGLGQSQLPINNNVKVCILPKLKSIPLKPIVNVTKQLQGIASGAAVTKLAMLGYPELAQKIRNELVHAGAVSKYPAIAVKQAKSRQAVELEQYNIMISTLTKRIGYVYDTLNSVPSLESRNNFIIYVDNILMNHLTTDCVYGILNVLCTMLNIPSISVCTEMLVSEGNINAFFNFIRNYSHNCKQLNVINVIYESFKLLKRDGMYNKFKTFELAKRLAFGDIPIEMLPRFSCSAKHQSFLKYAAIKYIIERDGNDCISINMLQQHVYSYMCYYVNTYSDKLEIYNEL